MHNLKVIPDVQESPSISLVRIKLIFISKAERSQFDRRAQYVFSYQDWLRLPGCSDTIHSVECIKFQQFPILDSLWNSEYTTATLCFVFSYRFTLLVLCGKTHTLQTRFENLDDERNAKSYLEIEHLEFRCWRNNLNVESHSRWDSWRYRRICSADNVSRDRWFSRHTHTHT